MGLIAVAGLESEACQRVRWPAAAGGQEALQAKNAVEGLCAVTQMLMAVTAQSAFADTDLLEEGADGIARCQLIGLNPGDASSQVRRRGVGGGAALEQVGGKNTEPLRHVRCVPHSRLGLVRTSTPELIERHRPSGDLMQRGPQPRCRRADPEASTDNVSPAGTVIRAATLSGPTRASPFEDQMMSLQPSGTMAMFAGLPVGIR